jgi:peptide/nickel transport system permease protein
MGFPSYLVRRLLYVIPVTFGVMVLLFFLFEVIGGSPARMVLGQNATSAAIEEWNADHGYDLPLFFSMDGLSGEKPVQGFFDAQFPRYMARLLQGDFGYSFATNQPVLEMIGEGIRPSLSLTIPIFVIGFSVAVAIALACAFYRNGLLDRMVVFAAVALMSIPYLGYILAGQYWLGYLWGWFPIWGYEGLQYLLLPWLIGIVSGLGGNVRFYRTVMLDQARADFIRTAFAKGCSARRVLWVHLLRNAMIPILTQIVITIPFLYTGSLLLESFFGIPGLGYMGVHALHTGDRPVLSALVFIGAMMFVLFNVLTDLAYVWMDRRIRLS